MELNPGILFQKLTYQRGFVSREIVQDDVDLLVPGALRDNFFEESNELAAGMARGGFAVNPPAGRVQSRIQEQRSVAVVLESVTLGTPRSKRQPRVKPVQRLNGSLFIHTEHRRITGRIRGQADDIGGPWFQD